VAVGPRGHGCETHDVALYVQPERDEAYAFVEPRDSDDRFLATESKLEPSSCGWTECSNDCCSEDLSYKEYWECYLDSSGNCVNCYISDTSRECSNCAYCDSDGLCQK
jgi:hypothetical protein